MMAADNSTGITDARAQAERENQIELTLLRGVVENLRGNRIVVPLFGLAIVAMFPQWVGSNHLAGWYCQMMLGLVPQVIVLSRFPAGPLDGEQTHRWGRIVAVANLFFIANWASLGLWMWAGGDKNSNHIMIQLLLAATLAAHAAGTGACRTIARPALVFYLVAMTLVPLQGIAFGPTALRSWAMALSAPLYVVFIAMVARRNEKRARAAAILAQERDSLMAELVMAKLESDRGREKAEAASIAKSQFLANMSHELRTPLNAILGFSELIASRIFGKEPERNYEYAELIHSSGKHLLALINDILDLAKIEAGRWKLEDIELDLHVVVRDALQLVAWRARDNRVMLVNAIPPDLALIRGDERAIKQILLNLLSNAVKFTPPHGRITAFANINGEGLAFGVADTGVGIAPEDHARVFDSFGQGKHDIAVADKGTGLGLAIVKGLVEAHGGHISLESEVGKGTRVTVQLPADRLCARALLRGAPARVAG
jgi:two-component system cell cycle sensor histidine kinase PleC